MELQVMPGPPSPQKELEANPVRPRRSQDRHRHRLAGKPRNFAVRPRQKRLCRVRHPDRRERKRSRRGKHRCRQNAQDMRDRRLVPPFAARPEAQTQHRGADNREPSHVEAVGASPPEQGDARQVKGAIWCRFSRAS